MPNTAVSEKLTKCQSRHKKLPQLAVIALSTLVVVQYMYNSCTILVQL